MKPLDPVEGLRAICSGVGYDLDHADSGLLDRMRLLAEHTQTFDDATRMAGYAHRVFEWYDAHQPDAAFDALERQTVVLGCLFSDVGKTGPEHADADARRLIADMFSVEGVHDDTMPVATFFEKYFDGDAGARLARFQALGLDASMTIRQFWNLHSDWTLAIAEAARLPLEAVAAAASHHVLDEVNPQSIVDESLRFTRSFGTNVAFDRSEKLIIVLDKYDAVRRRGKKDHAAAIAWLRQKVSLNPRFRDDAELATLIRNVDAALAEHEAG